MKPAVRELAQRLGLACGFMTPLLQGDPLLGQAVFAWKRPPALDAAARRLLRKLADYTALMLALYQGQRARELDPLTGLCNRIGLLRRWERVGRQPTGAVLFADLDGFKLLNDVLGHRAGDDFLRQLARILRDTAGPRAVVTRYGGDEFVVLVPGVDGPAARRLQEAIFEQVQRRVASRPSPRPTIAVGLALWPQDGRDLTTLLEKADQRMYQHKRRHLGEARIAGRARQEPPPVRCLSPAKSRPWPRTALLEQAGADIPAAQPPLA